MAQRGFWHEQQRVAMLKDKKPVPKSLADSIPWESISPLLGQIDAELECQVNDRRSFEEFVGLAVMDSIPDATTGAFFRERLQKA